MKSVIVGASAGLGRALAEDLARKGHSLFLVARHVEDLAAICQDLTIRHQVQVNYAVFDLHQFSPDELRTQAVQSLGSVDNLFLVAGISMIEKDFQSLRIEEIQSICQVNFTAPVQIAIAFLPLIKASTSGNLIGIGSVASARARGKNTIYASAKRGLEFFFAGVRHAFPDGPFKVQYYRVGFMDTQMMRGVSSPFPKASPARVAQEIAKGLDHDIPCRYLPGWWALIMGILSALPWVIFKKLKI